jgi:predicted RNase H-like HicB family nuclease
MRLIYPAIFYQGKDNDGYAVVVPDLPGCVSGGYTLEEAILMGTDAASGWVLGELEDGKPAPKASAITDIHPEPDDGEGSFVSMLVLDMDAYAAKYGNQNLQPVSKNLTIPAWLDTFATEKRIDYSKVLQDSLTEMYVCENQAAYSTSPRG